MRGCPWSCLGTEFRNNVAVSKQPKSPIPIEQIDGMIRTIRGIRVMLDRDLAKIYRVPRVMDIIDPPALPAPPFDV